MVRRTLLAFGVLLAAIPAQADDLDPGVGQDLNLDLMLSNLSAPVGGAFLPDGRLLLVEQFSGNVLMWDGQNAPSVVGNVDVQTGNERGLLGIAVDPEFATSSRVYFYYSTGNSQSVGWAAMDGAGQIDTNNITDVVTNLAANANHNGGAIAFGPDGHLYIGVGDTGCNCGCAPGTNTDNYLGTCLTNPNGKILRVDRDGKVPPSNPLVNEAQVAACGTGSRCRAAGTPPTQQGAPYTAIYNWGFRNPWRMAFDEESGYLWIGDVGERTWEEINISTGPGQHHGWPYREGAEGQPVVRCGETTPQSGDCKEPAFAYARREQPQTQAASVTGGVFSNHCSWPEAWRGRYWFGDYAKARVWAVTPNAARDGVDGERTVIVTGARGPVQFMRGPDGGIYYIAVNTGTLWRVTPANPESCGEMDASVPPDDAGPAPMDATTGPDANPDATLPNDPDDAGMASADAAGPAPDAGVSPAPDAGSETGDSDGCTCATPSDETPSAWWLGLGVLGLLVRRRR